MLNFRMYIYRSNLDPKLVSIQRYHDVAINGEIAAVFAEEDGQVPTNIHVIYSSKLKNSLFKLLKHIFNYDFLLDMYLS